MNKQRIWFSLFIAMLAMALLIPASVFATGRPDPTPGDGSNVTITFVGPVNSKSDAIPGPWVIAGRTVQVTRQTTFNVDPATIQMGDVVKVRARVDRQGALTALAINKVQVRQMVHFRGRIQKIADSYWMVAQQKVLLTADTVIEGAEPHVGDLAEVWGEPTADGVVASRLRVISRHRFTVIRGVVEAQSETQWVIDGRAVNVNENTRITGAPQVGDQVVAVVQVEGDGSFTARSIHKIPAALPQDRVTFSGFVTEIEEGSPTKWVVTRNATPHREAETWVVWVSEATQIWPEDAEVEVGSWVKGFGEPNEDESVNALAVRVVDAPRVSFAGEIQQQPESGVIGDWVIDGVTVHVSDATRVIGDPEGWDGYAQGYGVLNLDGSIDAIVIGPMPH